MSSETANTYFHGVSVHNSNNCEAYRLKTFDGWPAWYKASAIKLADAGFHRTFQEDEVQCSWCGVVKRDWRDGEKPHQVHALLSPRCPFLRGITGDAPSNVPIPKAKKWDDDMRRGLNVFLQEVGVPADRGIQESGEVDDSDRDVTALQFPGVNIRPRRNAVNLRLAGISSVPTAADGRTVPYTARPEADLLTNEPLYPNYADEGRRLDSFSNFPQEKAELVGPMCACGFFYMGLEDAVICYRCGLSRQDWRVGEDDPILEHARWRPACPEVSHLAYDVQRELQVVGV